MAATIRPKLTHAGVNCFDIKKMTRFYTEVMGLLETDGGKGITYPVDFVFLSSDPANHHQLVLASNRSPEAKASNINQLSFRVNSLDELRAMWRRVTEYGVKHMRSVSHGIAWSVYFDDPEGNTVEIYLDSPWYVKQPHGDPLDLNRSNEEIMRWTEETCRSDPSFVPVKDFQEKITNILRA